MTEGEQTWGEDMPYSLRAHIGKVTAKFMADMSAKGFHLGQITDENSRLVYVPVYCMPRLTPNVPLEFENIGADIRFGGLNAANSVYIGVPGHLCRGVGSLRGMSMGLRLLTEIDYWANENGKIQERGISQKLLRNEFDGAVYEQQNSIWSKYTINPKLLVSEKEFADMAGGTGTGVGVGP